MLKDLEIEVINRCKQGDLSAYKKLYQNYDQPLYRTALRLLDNKQEAEDAVQQCMINLYNNIGKFSYKSKFTTWLFRILINACYDILKKRKEFSLNFENDMIASCSLNIDLNMQLEEAIRQLPYRMRECFILYAIEGFKQNEIAQMLKVREGTVKAHIFQAKEKLRVLLKGVK